jgi:hypothetical protein
MAGAAARTETGGQDQDPEARVAAVLGRCEAVLGRCEAGPVSDLEAYELQIVLSELRATVEGWCAERGSYAAMVAAVEVKVRAGMAAAAAAVPPRRRPERADRNPVLHVVPGISGG